MRRMVWVGMNTDSSFDLLGKAKYGLNGRPGHLSPRMPALLCLRLDGDRWIDSRAPPSVSVVPAGSVKAVTLDFLDSWGAGRDE